MLVSVGAAESAVKQTDRPVGRAREETLGALGANADAPAEERKVHECIPARIATEAFGLLRAELIHDGTEEPRAEREAALALYAAYAGLVAFAAAGQGRGSVVGDGTMVGVRDVLYHM